MPLPEQDILQRGNELAAQRDPGFVTENLPSPDGFPDLKPIAVPGTGEFEYGDAQSKKTGQLSQGYINSVLGTQDAVTPGKLPTFRAADVYNPRYSSVLPGEDSEEAFAKGQSWTKQWGNAFVKFLATAGGTFANGMRAIPDTVSSIFGGTPYDTAMGNDIDNFVKNLENEFPNYYTKWETDHRFMSALPFSGGFSNFWGDKILKNMGFTVGAIGSAVATNYILGGIGGVVARLPGLSSAVGRTSLLLNKVFTGKDKLGSLASLATQAGRTSEQILQVERLATAAAATKVGSGLKYALTLYGSSASEAGYEARDAYDTVKNELMTAFQRENGYSPIGKELEEVEKYARDAANTRFAANLALLSISNAIQFDAFLKPFTVAKAGIRGAAQRELSQSGIGLTQGSIDAFERTAVKGVIPKIWNRIRPLTPAVLSEGIFEEGGQYAAQVATENYYVRKFLFDKGIAGKQYEKDETPWNAKDQIDNALHSIVRGMADEFGTVEGLENVFIGSIIGALSGGVQGFADRNKNKRQVQATLNALNSFGVTGTFQNNYESTVNAYRIAEDMRKAAETGDIFKYKNLQHEAFLNFMVSGIRAGRFDVRMLQLDMLKDMSDNEFKAAFGLDKTTDNLRTVGQYVDLLKDKANEIKRSYDLINDTFQNPYQLRTSIQTPEQAIENEKHHFFETWKDELTKLSSILPDVNRRINNIGTDIRDTFGNTNIQQVSMLTNRKAMKNYQGILQDRAQNLQSALDGKLSVDRPKDQKELRFLNAKIDDITAALGDPEFSGAKYEKFFEDMLSYLVNGETDKTDIAVPAAAIPKLIQFGVDINRLNEFKGSANKAFDILSSEEGLNKYFAEVQAEQQRRQAQPPPQQPGAPPPVKPARKTVVVRDPEGGGDRIYEEGVDYFIRLDNKPGSNPEKVKVLSQTKDGIVVQKEDGTQVTIPNEVFFAKDEFADAVRADVNEEIPNVAETPSTPLGDTGTQLGDAMKDLSFGTYSTTDPTYNRKDIPFNNFHRRHQNFLFNLGSSDPEVFNQENRAKLRIVPVTANNAKQFGFPTEFTEGDQSVDKAPIRAVYIVDDRMNSKEKDQLKKKIVQEVQDYKGISDIIKGMFTSNPEEAIDNFYQQFNAYTTSSTQGDIGAYTSEMQQIQEELSAIAAYKALQPAPVEEVTQEPAQPQELAQQVINEQLTEEEKQDLQEEAAANNRTATEELIASTRNHLEKKSIAQRILSAVKKFIKWIGLTFVIIGTSAGIFAATNNISLDDVQAYANRYLVKQGIVESDDADIETKIRTVPFDTAAARTAAEYKTRNTFFEKIQSIKQGPHQLWSYRNRWFNNDGFVYEAGASNKHFRENTSLNYDSVQGVAHHLIMISKSAYGSDLSDVTTNEALRTMSDNARRTFKDEQYIPIIERLGDNKVKITYERWATLKNKPLSANQFTPLNLRQTTIDDLDFNSRLDAPGFKKGIKSIRQHSTGQAFNSIVFKDRKSYGTFSGSSVVLIFQDSTGNTLVHEFTGSLDGIQQEINSLKQEFGVADTDITLGVYDAGSYTGKAESIGGRISPARWKSYNPTDEAGSTLMIPTQQPRKAEGPASILLLLGLLRRKRQNNEEITTDEENRLKDRLDELINLINKQRATQVETEVSLGPDIINLINAYKSDGLFYTDEHGEKAGRVGDPVNPDNVIFTTFASTDLTYEARGGQQASRYTNKQNLDEKKVQDWWRDQRKDILSINSMAGTPLYQFDVSRGLPHIVNYDLRNSVTQVGLITKEDFDKPLLTIPTVGDIANIGAYNAMGEGISAAKAATNMPLGYPILNFGGNMIFLNGRTFSPSEARNIVSLLMIASDRSTNESRKGIFTYLNRIIQMGNPSKGVKASASSITVDGNSLFLGTSTDPIQFTPSDINANKEKIFEFLLKVYHGVRNSELLRIAKNPKANDLAFVELGVEDGKVVALNTWKNYNHYLLSDTTPDGKKRGQPILTTNIAVPQPGESPIIQKYSVLRSMDFDSKLFQKPAGAPVTTPPPAPPKPSPTPAAAEKADVQQGVKGPDAPVPNAKSVAEVEANREKELDEIVDAKSGTKKRDIERIRNVVNKKYDAQLAAIKSAAPKEESPVQWIQIGQLKLGFTNIIKDADGNITDLTPAGLIQQDGSITPFPQPDVVKTTILDILRKNQPKKDETTSSNKPSWLGNPNLKKGNDDQYRQFLPGESYAKGDVDAEFKEAQRMLGDDQLFVKVQHILKTTGGGFAYGAFIDNVIYVWQGAKVGTTFHEVFEKVWGTFLTGREQQDLYDEFITREGTFTTFGQGDIKFSEVSMQQAKEQMAEEFTEFILTKKLPQHKRQRNFFQRLWDYIKKIIFGDSSDINLLYKAIDKGYYRNFSTSLRGPLPAQYREAALEDLSEAFIQDTLQGMTIEMFMQAYREASDIVAQMEDNKGIPVTSIYAKLKSNLTHYFEETSDQYNNTFAAEMNTKYLTLTKEDDKSTFEAQVISILESWQKIKDKWEAFVNEHKRYLKVFNVEFTVDDDGNISFNEEDTDFDDQNKSQTEYDRDIFKIDAKNSASTKIKLLIATLADSYWKEAAREAIGATRSNEIGIKRDNSIVSLPKQVQYAKLFNYLLHNTSNINGIYDMWIKMSSMTEDVATRKPIDANLQRLMNRVDFRGGFQNKTINQAKLILALENTLAKQKPAFFRQFVDVNNQVFFKTSVLNSKIGQVKASWIADIKGSGSIIGTAEKNFRFSKSVIGITDPINFLSKIGIEIPRKDYNKLNARDRARFNEAVNVVRELVERAANTEAPIPIISAKQMDFDSRLNDLADLYVSNMVGDDAQSQHPNLDNEPTSNFVLPNYVITVLNDANSSATREEFLNKQDMGYMRDIFHRDSILLAEVLFTPLGEFNQAVSLGVVEGREKWDQSNRSTSSLTEPERQVYEINNNLNGVFYTLLPADSKTEWAIHAGTYLSPQNFFADSTTRGNEVTRFSNQMYKWLQTEVELAKDYENRKDVVALNRKVDGRPVGKSLRFFKDLLPKNLVDIIHRDAIDKGIPLGNFFTAAGLRPYMVTLIEQKAKQSLDNLLEWQVFSVGNSDDEYIPFGIDRIFLSNFLGDKQGYTKEELMRLLAFREANYIMNNIEVHKLFFGDPAQYKDELKRIKSFLSGREQTHVDTLNSPQGFNDLANRTLNNVSGAPLKPGDPGYHQFKNYAATITVRDVIFESNSIEDLTKVLGEKAASPYTEGNEADAQAIIMPTFYREIMYKAGGRFTAAQERQFQWEMAWERDDKAKDGKYTYSSKELQKADKLILQSPLEEVEFPILKLMHSGIQTKNGKAIASLDKASWAPSFYRWVKGRAAEKIYNSLQRKGRDYMRMESAHKVGIQDSSLTDLYDSDGNVNVLQLDAIEDEYIPLKFFGVQVEQSKKGKGQTEGSQTRKIVTADLKSNGVPVDFIAQYQNEEIAYEEWNKLSDKQKLEKSPLEGMIRRHDNALIRLVEARVEKAIIKLGMKNENGVLVTPDKKAVSDFILRELERRELPRNIAYGLEVADGEFVQPLEANAQYSKIRQIIYSIIDDTIMRPTVNGGQKTMLAVTGWEKNKRIVKKMVNGKPVYTSNELKFYKQGDGKTEACEIMLPYWFGKMLRDKGSLRTKEEVIDYLNNTAEGQALIKGIGFRIPTQGLNSIDFFTVKDFLPEGMGSAIVLPSEITVKAGSDFDIDKLNVYLRNFYIDNKTGYPRAVEYKGSQEGTMKYLEELLDTGNVITREEAKELDRIIAEENDDVDFDDFLMRIPGVADMFSDVQLTREFLKGRREYILNKMYIQSLENEYFDSIESILSLPFNFKRLVQPNSADEMKGYRTKLLELKGQSEKQNPLGDFGRLVDSQYMMRERQAYMSSKGVVGTSAVSQVSHAVSQNMDGGLLVYTPSVEARFPHNTIAGKITLSGLYTTGTENFISNINSQTTDGGVDVSKDKFLAEMGITSDTLKDFLALTRMGASAWWGTLYLNQPAIQEFLKTKAIHASVSLINPWVRNISDRNIITSVRATFGVAVKGQMNKPKVYTISQMESMIEKYAKGQELSYEERLLQIMMLDDYTRYNKAIGKYEGYSALGWYLFDFYQGYNWDTARINDPNAIRLKELRYEKANNNPISPVSNIMRNSFIGAMMKGALRLDQGLRSVISIQQGGGDAILNRLAKQLFATTGLSEQTRRDLMLAAELSMVDYMVQTNSEVLGRSINNYMFPIILGDKAIALYIKAIQKSNDKRLTNNPFIRNLIANIDTRSGFPSLVTLAERDYDTYTSNTWTDGFEEMKDDVTIISINDNEADDRTVGQIYRNLVLAAILQSGSKRTSNSLSHLVPNETYSEFTAQAIRAMNLEGFWENDVFYRTNWANNKLVTKVEPEPIDPDDPFTEMDYPIITNSDMDTILKQLTGSERVPRILNVLAWKYSRKKAIKILSPLRDQADQLIGFVPALYIRVDVPSMDGVQPLSFMENRVVFKEINPWGDGRYLAEYYRDARPSVLPLNSKLTEATDDQIIYAAYRAGFKMNVAEDYISSVIQRFDEGGTDTDEDGNTPPDPDPVPVKPSPSDVSTPPPYTFMEIETDGWKKSGKKETFQIHLIDKPKEEVQGYRISVINHPNMELFVYGKRGDWSLSDAKSGKNIATGKTIGDVVENGITIMNKAMSNPDSADVLRTLGVSQKEAQDRIDNCLKK